MLRALKHRFGATDELGLMEMTTHGLVPVNDPSALFLADRRVGATGSVVTAVMEGTRPLCVEVQSLVAPTGAPIPRRIAQAFEGHRLSMLVAVLQQRAGIGLGGHDVYASVAGGVRVAEPAADLAVALAIAGARNDYAVDSDTIVIGEIGLGGEMRQVPQAPRRLTEALRLGFRRAIVPLSTPDVRGVTARSGRRYPRSSGRDHLRRGVASDPVPTGRICWRRADRKFSTPRCGSWPRAHRCARASTASCRRRWARSSSWATVPRC